VDNAKLQVATSYPAVLGRLLTQARSVKGLDQSRVAEAVGVSQSTWSRIEKGEIALTIEQLAAACGELGVQPSDILQQTDLAARRLTDRGVTVTPKRPNTLEKALEVGLVILGAAALAALVASVLSDEDGPKS
jgi:transcriptional regulator with XRE-family HTH domain